MGDAVDGDLSFFHCLQQRRLSLGCCAIDLVGQHHLREDWPRAKFERTALRIEHAHAGDIAGQKIRRELDSLKTGANTARDSLCQYGLANSGNVLDKYMTPANECNQQELNFPVLANDYAFNVARGT